MEDFDFDVVIIGAGLSGIAFARFFLDTHPQISLIIVEQDAFIGGVWSQTRVFDAFWTQSPLRMTAFSDRTLQLPKDVPVAYDTFEAKYVTSYLEEYVDSHVYQGRSLRDHIWLNARVSSIEKKNTGWTLRFDNQKIRTVTCSKVAVASGLTSAPIMPDFPLDSQWTTPIIHHRDFGVKSQSILATSSPYRNITIIGGGKSAADMVYAAIKANKRVSWIIRRSGEGPGIFVNPTPPDGYRNVVERGATQNATALSPSGFRPMQPWALELHQMPSKRAALESKLFAGDRSFKEFANYNGRENALACFAELKPSASFFWNNGPIGMIQHDDFWDLVSQRVRVYRADPIGTTTASIVLEDRGEVPTDVLFCGTGWSSDYSFLSLSQIRELGLPHDRSSDSEKSSYAWQSLIDAADEQVISKYPILGDPPPGSARFARDSVSPAQLYQGIAPLSDASIIFLGRARMSNSFRGADAQAIWATAYWDGHIKLPPKEQLYCDVAYMNAFSKRRYPTRGIDGLNFHGDLVWYTDKLITEAGLFSHRKKWWRNGDEPCVADDMRDCKDEYLDKYGAFQ